jgi:type I restriction enzyme S subunit
VIADCRLPISDWKTVTLGDVAEFVRGINFKPEDVVPTGTPGSVACMRTKNVQTELDLSDVWSVGEQFVRREDQFLQVGDVLVSSANSWNLVGKCCWIPELPGRASFGGFVSVLRPHRTKVEPRFLYRWFSSDRIQTTLRSFGQQTTNISNLNTDRCLKLPLPLPPLAEQRRIAEVLDKAEALRAKRRAALAELDSLTQSIFLDLFGDPLKNTKHIKTAKLGSLCVRVTDGTHQPPKWSTDGHPFLFVSNIVTGEITFDTEKFISEETHAELTRRCPIELGDVLYSTVGSYGVPAIVRSERKFAFQRHIAHLKPDRTLLDSQFLAAMLASPPLKRQADRAAKGVAQKTVNLSEIREFVVFQPPLTLQREFARRVGVVEKLKTAQRASLAELDALFATLQHRAFQGEL